MYDTEQPFIKTSTNHSAALHGEKQSRLLQINYNGNFQEQIPAYAGMTARA